MQIVGVELRRRIELCFLECKDATAWPPEAASAIFSEPGSTSWSPCSGLWKSATECSQSRCSLSRVFLFTYWNSESGLGMWKSMPYSAKSQAQTLYQWERQVLWQAEILFIWHIKPPTHWSESDRIFVSISLCCGFTLCICSTLQYNLLWRSDQFNWFASKHIKQHTNKMTVYVKAKVQVEADKGLFAVVTQQANVN